MMPRNAILRSLMLADFLSLQPYMNLTALSGRAVLHEFGKPFEHVYFVESGVVSLMTGAHCEMIQTATVSNRGVVGATVACETNIATHHAVVFAAGVALRISASDLRRIIAGGHPIQRILFQDAIRLLEVGCQTALCVANHSNEQRLGSWLVATAAELEGHAIPITHVRLAEFLGIRRAGLTDLLTRFERSGFIRKERGHIVVCSPDKLQASACDCYRARGIRTLCSNNDHQAGYRERKTALFRTRFDET